ncbi:MAG TPA: hypothetical protein VFE47_11610 [Tepidisphaeraceae bacterium]|nr:hypothetical protein [Tepidisphaeraceae bacterium]
MRNNRRDESSSPEQLDVVRTKGDTSLSLYLLLIASLILLPWGLALLLGSSGRVGTGLAAAVAGTAALGCCAWMLSLKVFISSEGLVFGRWWQRRRIGWDEIQRVRFSRVSGRSRSDGGLVIVNGGSRSFHFIAQSHDYNSLKGYLAMRCPNALLMDFDEELIRPPANGDDESRQTLVREAGRQMGRRRAISSGISICIVVCFWVAAFRNHHDAHSRWLVSIICAILAGGLGLDIFRIAKKFWR